MVNPSKKYLIVFQDSFYDIGYVSCSSIEEMRKRVNDLEKDHNIISYQGEARNYSFIPEEFIEIKFSPLREETN
jgi:hypothetical protein